MAVGERGCGGLLTAGERGSTLIESLAALTLMAAAGAVIAAAATTSLRAARHAAECERLTAIAARELARVQARGAPEETSERRLDDSGFAGPARLSTLVSRRPDGIAELRVTVDLAGNPGEAPASPITLTTHMLVGE
jgi:type II secretory pathway pseudopilin PulG